MSKDKILTMFFQKERWEYAIAKGVGKDISKAELYRLTKPEMRAAMYEAIRAGKYEIAPPRTAKIPKDNGEFRTVYINTAVDRIFLSIANDLLFDLTPEMIHPTCTSYQRGLGCGKVVKAISKEIAKTPGNIIGWKSDLSKYFDSVPLRYIDKAFDLVEEKHGHSAVIDVLRKYYHSDWYWDTDGNLVYNYQSLKQGCSVASWLANVILYHIDDKISKMDVKYVRYSDDMLCVGNDKDKAMETLEHELALMDMKLNPKKVEPLYRDKWFKFLGFSLRGQEISISGKRLKTFQKEIENRTIGRRGTTLAKALNAVHRYLYVGDGQHSWATQVFATVNVREDLNTLNGFVLDCLRAVATGKKRVGSLYFSPDDKE